jgi:hypothetical protein
MHHRKSARAISFGRALASAALLLLTFAPSAASGQGAPAHDAGVAVEAQYDSADVYAVPGDLDALASPPRSVASRRSAWWSSTSLQGVTLLSKGDYYFVFFRRKII